MPFSSGSKDDFINTSIKRSKKQVIRSDRDAFGSISMNYQIAVSIEIKKGTHVPILRYPMIEFSCQYQE